MHPAPPPKAPTPRSRSRRIAAWFLRAALVLVALVGAYFLATDSFLTRLVVMSQLGAKAGGHAHASSVSLSRDGTLTMTDVELRAPGVPGEGGVVFRAKRVVAQLELASLLTGTPRIHAITLDQPLARVSQSLDDGSVNVASLSPPKGSGGPIEIPRMLVRDGVIELGEHAQATGAPSFTSLRRIPVAGEVERSRDQSGRMEIAFHELDLNGQPLAGPGGLDVEGSISKDAVTVDLGVLDLSSWPAASMPRPIRGIYESLALQGRVFDARLTYDFTGQVEAKAYLSGVGVTLPVEARAEKPGEKGPPRRLRMQDVRGTLSIRNSGLSANLDGVLEELPYHVELDYKGASADAPFTGMMRSTNFALGENPEILRFAPDKVRERLAQFSDPTGVLDAEIHLDRGPPVNGQPADIAVTGSLRFRNTTAAFTKFPYRFHNISGVVHFSEKEVVIEDIKGEAPGGVTMSARVVVAPPNEDAAVDVDVTVNNLPVDDTLRSAMQQRVALLDAVFNRQRYQELLDKGRIVAPDNAAGETRERPIFVLGGRANVRTHVHSPPGKESPWHDRVEIDLLDAGLLPDRVPYPVRARGVKIIKDDDRLTVSGGKLTGLLGGDIQLHVDADINALLQPDTPAVPDIEVRADALPLDSTLIDAIPHTPGLDRVGLADRLRALNLGGSINLIASLRNKNNDVDYRVQVDALQCVAAPLGPDGVARVAYRDVDGSIDATPQRVTVELAGRVTPPDRSPATGQTRVQATLEDSTTRATADVSQLDLTLPVEDLLRPFAAQGAERLATLRAERRPSGEIDAHVQVVSQGDQSPQLSLKVSKALDVAIDHTESRIGLTLDQGTIDVDWPGGDAAPAHISLDAARGEISYNQQDAGRFAANGAFLSNGLPDAEGRGLSLTLTGARFECGLLSQALTAVGSHGVQAFFQSARPRGRFDLDLALTSQPDRAGWTARGGLAPKSLTLAFDQTDVAWPTMSGRIDFDGQSGRIDHLVAGAPNWEARIDGSFVREPSGATMLEAAASIDAASLTPDLVAVLPSVLKQAASDLSIRVDRTLTVPELQVRVSFDPDGGLTDLTVDGDAKVQGLAIEPGVQIENADGAIDFSAQRTPNTPASFEIFGLLPAARVGGVEVTSARVRIAGTPDGRVIVPQFSADCHGGKITGDATVGTPPASDAKSPQRREYQVTVRTSGVRFASLLQDWNALPAAQREAASEPTQPDRSRGELDANVTLAGVIGDAASRRGRGSGAIAGGTILTLPLIVPLVRVSNLELPVDEPLDFANAEFFIQGPLVNFEQLSVFSQSVQITGFGTLEWPSTQLDMRFRPKARNRIPLITSLVESVRDELLAAQVQGSLTNPVVEMKTLSGTTRFVGRIFGDSPTQQQQRLDRIERQAENSPAARRVDRDAIAPDNDR